MKHTLTIIVVTDAKGNEHVASLDEIGQGIHLSGVWHADGETRSFESEGYHLPAWAAENNFAFVIHHLTLDLKSRTAEGWWTEEAKAGDVRLTHCPACKAKLPNPGYRSARYIEGMRSQGCLQCDHGGSGSISLVGAEQV